MSPVRVHLNLHRAKAGKGDEWTVTPAKGGKVIGHVATITLRDVSFRVSEATRQRILTRTKHREVHAWAVGEPTDGPAEGAQLIEITYNPFRDATFIRRDTGQPIEGADFVLFVPGKRAFAINPN
jgi:hypothetical protein